MAIEEVVVNGGRSSGPGGSNFSAGADYNPGGFSGTSTDLLDILSNMTLQEQYKAAGITNDKGEVVDKDGNVIPVPNDADGYAKYRQDAADRLAEYTNDVRLGKVQQPDFTNKPTPDIQQTTPSNQDPNTTFDFSSHMGDLISGLTYSPDGQTLSFGDKVMDKAGNIFDKAGDKIEQIVVDIKKDPVGSAIKFLTGYDRGTGQMDLATLPSYLLPGVGKLITGLGSFFGVSPKVQVGEGDGNTPPDTSTDTTDYSQYFTQPGSTGDTGVGTGGQFTDTTGQMPGGNSGGNNVIPTFGNDGNLETITVVSGGVPHVITPQEYQSVPGGNNPNFDWGGYFSQFGGGGSAGTPGQVTDNGDGSGSMDVTTPKDKSPKIGDHRTGADGGDETWSGTEWVNGPVVTGEQPKGNLPSIQQGTPLVPDFTNPGLPETPTIPGIDIKPNPSTQTPLPDTGDGGFGGSGGGTPSTPAPTPADPPPTPDFHFFAMPGFKLLPSDYGASINRDTNGMPNFVQPEPQKKATGVS